MSKDPETVVNTARTAFNSGITKTYGFRLSQLRGLQQFVEDNEQTMIQKLKEDNKKPKFECYIGEIIHMQNVINTAINNLERWMEPESPSKPLPFIMDQIKIYPEPYGVVLIVGAWNYPFSLIIEPLTAAIAAGNCAIVKPSEAVPGCAKLLEEQLLKYLDNSCFNVYNGGVPETTALLTQRFDYIFYTGSTAVGKIVYAAAAKFLTPVTLELGGKSPVYLDDSADVDIAASRIMWGKCVNAGQSCIEPDYLLCTEYMRDKFVQAAKRVVKKWYGENVAQNNDFGRIINDHHFKRISKLIEGQQIAMGGNTNAQDLFIEPTILIDVKPDEPIMQEEIFGPVLPILTVATPEDAIEFINGREKPLAIYVFSSSPMEQDKFINGTSSGGLCINDVMSHYICDSLPFGGVGSSGIGSYHGEYSFKTFSHQKGTVIKKLSKVGEYTLSVKYPPYTDKKLNIIKKVLKKLPPIPGQNISISAIFLLLSIIITLLNFWCRG